MLELRTRPDGCLTDLTFDGWFAGELEQPAREAAREHLAGCRRCRERHAELDAQRAAYLARRPLPEIRSAARPARARALGPIALAGGLLAGAAAIALVVRPAPQEPPDAVRTKGGPHIGFYVQHGDRAVRGEPGSTVRPGELVRFAYSSPEPAFLAIYGRIAGSAASTYFPAAEQAGRVPAGRDALLPSGVALDGALGAETVLALFCDAPFSVEGVRAQLGQPAAFVAEPGCRVDTLTWVKVGAAVDRDGP